MREINRHCVSSGGGSQSDCWFRGGRTHGSTPQPFISALMCVINTTRTPIWTLTLFPPSTPDISARPCFPSRIWGDVSRYVHCWKRDCGRYFLRSFASHVDLLSVSRVSNIARCCFVMILTWVRSFELIWLNMSDCFSSFCTSFSRIFSLRWFSGLLHSGYSLLICMHPHEEGENDR